MGNWSLESQEKVHSRLSYTGDILSYSTRTSADVKQFWRGAPLNKLSVSFGIVPSLSPFSQPKELGHPPCKPLLVLVIYRLLLFASHISAKSWSNMTIKRMIPQKPKLVSSFS
jgi:hypothetical protein